MTAAKPEGETAGRGTGRCRLALPVVLIGLMGAGKTSVGLRLADMLGVPFRDSDSEVEEAAGMSIPDIFARFGEAHFRDGERKVIARLLGEAPSVLATGGGAYMNEATRALIGERAVAVWLKADLDLLASRTAGRSHRPLLNTGDPRAVLARLKAEREPVYAEAAVHVESLPGQSHEAMATRILEALAHWQKESGRTVLERTP